MGRGLMRLYPCLATAVLVSLSSACINISLLQPPGPLKEKQIAGNGQAKVLLVELSGLISSHEEEGFMPRPSVVARVKEELNRAADDESIKALVLRINSPGGTVTASDILYHEVRAFRQKRKIPIVASIMDVGASGGYYVAMAADKVLAHPSSVTGSVGVIMVTMNARGLLDKVGLQASAVTSGPKKDMGSPFRPMTDEERAIFQGVIDSFYDRFLTVVREGRPQMSPEQIRRLADGRIYAGEQAKALGLLDGVGYLDDAIELAKSQAGLAQARIVTYHRPGTYQNNIYSAFMNSATWPGLPRLDLMALLGGSGPQFLYLWMP